MGVPWGCGRIVVLLPCPTGAPLGHEKGNKRERQQHGNTNTRAPRGHAKGARGATKGQAGGNKKAQRGQAEGTKRATGGQQPLSIALYNNTLQFNGGTKRARTHSTIFSTNYIQSIQLNRHYLTATYLRSTSIKIFSNILAQLKFHANLCINNFTYTICQFPTEPCPILRTRSNQKTFFSKLITST